MEVEAVKLKKNNVLRFITAGSVDDGKSTLIGRLLFDSKNIFSDQFNTTFLSKKYKFSYKKKIDFSLIVDALEAEIEQGITIDVAYRYFSSSKRKFIIADTPGHEQYTRNMVTGASTADAVIILIDVSKIRYTKFGDVELLTQTKRHSAIASLLKIENIILAINKMDLIYYNANIYNKVVNSYLSFAKNLDIKNVVTIPICALSGENIVNRDKKILKWYNGMTLLEVLEFLPIMNPPYYKSFRFPVQMVMRYNNIKNNSIRGYMGQIKSGIVKISDKLILYPRNIKVTVNDIRVLNESLKFATSGNSVTIFLNETLDISRGDMLAGIKEIPNLLKTFNAVICWLSEDIFDFKCKYLLKHTSKQVVAYITRIRSLLNINNQKLYFLNSLKMNDIASVIINTQNFIIADEYESCKTTGSFIMIDQNSNQTVAAGMIKF